MTQDEFNPYVGPRPFERKQEDSARFFGRSQETEEIVSLIFGHPVILVYAQSGAGKTSLFNASVTLKLEENGFDVLPLTRVGGIVPKGIVLQEIKNLYIFNALLKIDSQTDPRTFSSTSLCAFLEKRVRTNDENGQPRPRVIIFDQFEELFTYTPEHWREQREGFFLQVVEALTADPLLRVVFVIREDFLAELDPYSRILPERLRTRYRLERLGESAALRAIKEPLINTNRKFAAGVAEALVKELLTMRTVDATGKTADIEGQYVEPVQLQVVCVTLWSTLKPDVSEIQKTLLENFKVDDALSDFYKSAVEDAAKETGVPEEELRNWFGKTLITSMGTRSTVFRGEDSTGNIKNGAVDFLESRHIIRAEFRAGARWYELTHDRLVEPILESNKLWFEKHSSLLQRQTTLWIAQGRPDGMLLRGDGLEQAETESRSRTITQDETDFLNACKKLREREIREKRQNLFVRLLASVAIAALIVAVGFAVSARQQAAALKAQQQTAEAAVATATYSLGQANIAVAQANSANANAESARGLVEADRLAGQAQIALGRLNTMSLGQLLAVEAYKMNLKAGGILPSVYQALYDSAESGQNKVLLDGVFSQAQFGSGSNDNWLILDNTLWNVISLQAIRLVDTEKILQTAFQPDGQIVIITGETGYSSSGVNVYVKDKANRTKNQFHLTASDSGNFTDIKLSEDGGWIATSYDSYITSSGIQIWNVASSSLVDYLPIRAGLSEVAITRDGSKIAASNSSSMYIWQNTGTKLQGVAQVPLSLTYSNFYYSTTDKALAGKPGNRLQFSPDGHWLAYGKGSNITIWGESSLAPIRVTTGANGEVAGFLFSPDSKSLVYVVNQYCYEYYSPKNCKPSSSLVRVLLATPDSTGIQPILEKSDANITTLDISPSGRLVVGDELGTVRAWDLDNKLSNLFVGVVHAGRVNNLALAADNQTVVSSGETDGTRIWRLSDKPPVAVIAHRSTATISDVIRTADMNNLIIAGDLRTANDSDIAVRIVSNVNTPPSVNEVFLSSHTGSISAFAISNQWAAAGRAVGSGYSEIDYSLDLWNLTRADSTASTLSIPLPFGVRSLAFSQDDSKIAIAPLKNQLWMDTIKNIQQLGVSFDNAGNNSSTGAVATPSQAPFATIMSSGLDDIQSLVFVNNDQYLIGASTNGVHLWDLNDVNKTEYDIQDAISPIHVSPDQEWLVTGSSDNALRAYQVGSLMSNSPVIINTDSAVTQFSFNQKGNWLAVATVSGKVSIYQFPTTTGSQPAFSLQGPTDIVGLEFSPNWPDQKWLVAVSTSNAYLWNLNNSGNSSNTASDNPVVLQGHHGNILYAGFVDDGKWIMTAGADQSIRFWSLDPENLLLDACEYAGRNLSAAESKLYLNTDVHPTCGGIQFATAQQLSTPTMAPTRASSTQIALYTTPTATATPSVIFITYSVKQGDTLSLIALKFHVTLDTLIADNNITNPTMISIGETFKVRVTNTPLPP